MGTLGSDFIEKKASLMKQIPEEWLVGGGSHFHLDLKMCQIKKLAYEFHWGTSRNANARNASIIDTPHKILSLDVSLNDLETLSHESLAQFPQLRLLNASLNHIQSFLGVEVLKNLYSLNLSHNTIKHIHGLQELKQLTQLHLGMNQIEDISYMPTLSNLKILHLNNNKVKTLDGIQSLANITELYAQHNQIKDLLPLSSSLRLKALNVSDNLVSSLATTIEVLKELHRLDSLALYGNPVEKENNYQSKILETTTVRFLDNIAIHPQLKTEPTEKYEHAGNLTNVKDAARQAFLDYIKHEKMKSDEKCYFLQQRIHNIKDEFKELEENVYLEMDACMRYMDSLSVEEAQQYNFHSMKESLQSPGPRPWHTNPSNFSRPSALLYTTQGHEMERRGNKGKNDYSEVRETDEVLRHAYNELTKDRNIWNGSASNELF